MNYGPYNNNLRELFYDRNPGDARVKVGSERQAASSRTGRMTLRLRSAIQQYGICPRGPSKSGPVIWEFTPTKLFRSYFTICFLPEPGPEERGGEVGTGPEPVPRLLICFGRRI